MAAFSIVLRDPVPVLDSTGTAIGEFVNAIPADSYNINNETATVEFTLGERGGFVLRERVVAVIPTPTS